MRNLRRRVLPAVLASMLLIGAAGCSDDSSSSGDSDAPEQVGS